MLLIWIDSEFPSLGLTRAFVIDELVCNIF